MRQISPLLILIAVLLPAVAVTLPAGAKEIGDDLKQSSASGSVPSPAPISALSASIREPTQLLQKETQKESAPGSSDNRVEDFFQVSKGQRNSETVLLMRPFAERSSDNKGESDPHGFIWHVLDAAGIPVSWGKRHSFIDPEIKETYVIPAPMLPREGTLAQELEQRAMAPDQPLPANSPALLQKIPVSELEGVALPTPGDENVAKH